MFGKMLGSIYLKKWFLKLYPVINNNLKLWVMNDPVRYYSLYLAIENIKKHGIKGAFAEVGIYRGKTSRIIHRFAPQVKFYLFDTFEGFSLKDLKGRQDNRFKETNIDIVLKNIGDSNNIIIRKGTFPETAQGLEGETFSFVMLDLDLYEPTSAGLRFFYPRMCKSGYIFVHDYNSKESDFAVSRAVDEFMKDKLEQLIEIPDYRGSVIIRKI